MGLGVRFIPHSVNISTAAPVAAWINGVETTDPELGITLFEESSGSAIDREFVAARDVKPTIPIVTSDLTAIATVGVSGLQITCGSGTPGLTVFARDLVDGSVPGAIGSSLHLAMLVTDGLIVPVSISASHNAAAKLRLSVHPKLGTTVTYSGATPIVATASSTITSGAGQTANIFTTGPVKWTVSGGSSQLLQGIANLNVDFGLQVLTESSDGDVYPSHISIISRMSRISFTTKDVQQIAAIGDGISVSAFAAYFRQVAANGQRVAPATTSHIKIAGTAGMITPSTLNLAHKQPGTLAFTYTPVLNTNQLVVTNGAAIPTS